VRILVLAIVRHHVDSCVEVHGIYAISAFDSVHARVALGLDHIVTRAGYHSIGAGVVGAYGVRTASAE
jgi:hypothetical protein